METTRFSHDLLRWFDQNARQLPWRETTDPYRIWVSEVMLQQTRVETVIPYFHRFLSSFPTLETLASAPEEEVVKAWEGLGYYRRVRLLQQGVREVMTRYGGAMPQDPDALTSLPGVGPYMAGALGSIAFGLPIPAVDGNVIRVVSRILAWPEAMESPHTRRVITAWVRERYPADQTRAFAEALMELGALICLPRNPRCGECPVCLHCAAGEAGNPEAYPVKKPARTVPAERRVVLRITHHGRRLLLQRPEGGLMAGFWEYPNLLANATEDAFALARGWTEKNLGGTVKFSFHTALTQVFTHRRWDVEVYDGCWTMGDEPFPLAEAGWYLPEEEKKLSRVAFVRKLETEG